MYYETIIYLFCSWFVCLFVFGKTELRSILFLHINLIFNLNIFHACFHYYLTILIHFSFHFIFKKKLIYALVRPQAIELPGSVLGRGIRTSDLRFIKRDLSRLNYLLGMDKL
jgi:hypothetical protein